MDFILWLYKRITKPIVDFWNEDNLSRVVVMICMFVPVIIIDVVISLLLGSNDNNPESPFYFWLTLGLILVILVVTVARIPKQVNSLYQVYLTEQPEKPKRKTKSIEDNIYAQRFESWEERRKQLKEDIEDYNAERMQSASRANEDDYFWRG